ncbi:MULTISPECIES: hypothetical protein [Methylomonas]|uniref:IPTL-CTERM protein sorting domain-containing protein n=2 Tax=Methylomonas TaxID=416 RepID=A0A126T743_9GAMM|nr:MULTISPECIES: hypothetical protein [Methylomonas]AMK77584.1 hypothetical protein JT25_014020 [Methylomonas denitrificans]OAI05163.1 hypothetical protein A1342_12185 [Methylomonas methanica]TCV84372.1 putative secreted protein [Methylomonas methanica]
MKTLLSLKLWLAVCLFAVSTASSAGIIWESTDGDSNFISFGSSPFPSLSSETFGIFSATANLAADAPVYTFNGVGSFSSASPFKLGLLTTSGWVSEVGNYGLGTPNTFLLSFVKPNVTANNLSFLFGFDLKPAANQNPISGVPLPASVWFMTSAMLGFLYIGRRKQVV